MPFADPERARHYFREYRRLRRGGDTSSTPSSTPPSDDFRLQTATDVVALMEAQCLEVLEDDDLSTLQRARMLGYLSSISLRAIEAGNLTLRIEAIELALKAKKGCKR